MITINDKRNSQEHLLYEQLEQGEVYISVRMGRYLLSIDNNDLVELSTGETFCEGECQGDAFIKVKASIDIT